MIKRVFMSENATNSPSFSKTNLILCNSEYHTYSLVVTAVVIYKVSVPEYN